MLPSRPNLLISALSLGVGCFLKILVYLPKYRTMPLDSRSSSTILGYEENALRYLIFLMEIGVVPIEPLRLDNNERWYLVKLAVDEVTRFIPFWFGLQASKSVFVQCFLHAPTWARRRLHSNKIRGSWFVSTQNDKEEKLSKCEWKRKKKLPEKQEHPSMIWRVH